MICIVIYTLFTNKYTNLKITALSNTDKRSLHKIQIHENIFSLNSNTKCWSVSVVWLWNICKCLTVSTWGKQILIMCLSIENVYNWHFYNIHLINHYHQRPIGNAIKAKQKKITYIYTCILQYVQNHEHLMQ